MLSDIRNCPYRKMTKIYDVTVTSSKVLQSPNFPQTLPIGIHFKLSKFHVRSSSGFGDISQNVKRGNFMPPPPRAAARGLISLNPHFSLNALKNTLIHLYVSVRPKIFQPPNRGEKIILLSLFPPPRMFTCPDSASEAP